MHYEVPKDENNVKFEFLTKFALLKWKTVALVERKLKDVGVVFAFYQRTLTVKVALRSMQLSVNVMRT